MDEKDQKPAAPALLAEQKIPEVGGPKGLEPTRFGDWCDDKGRVSDF